MGTLGDDAYLNLASAVLLVAYQDVRRRSARRAMDALFFLGSPAAQLMGDALDIGDPLTPVVRRQENLRLANRFLKKERHK